MFGGLTMMLRLITIPKERPSMTLTMCSVRCRKHGGFGTIQKACLRQA